MKQQDIATIIVVAVVGAVVSFIAADLLFKPSQAQLNAPVVAPIQASFSTPSSTYFNGQSLNPMGSGGSSPDSNNDPFGGQ